MRTFLAALLTWALISSPIMAQSQLDSWDNLNQLRVGQKVEVLGWDMKSVKGTFAGYSADSVSVKADRDVVIVPRAKIFKVVDRERSRRSRNALIGMSVGVGIGLALGLATKSDFPLGVPLGLFVGSTAAGVAAGAAMPGHPTIYKSSTKPPSR